MIRGTGVDIIEIARVERAAARPGFAKHILSPDELAYWEAHGAQVRSLAGAFAAKEAVSKAFGLGIGDIAWTDIEVLHDALGKPYIRLAGRALFHMRRLDVQTVHISISHAQAYAIAQAILEGTP